MFLQRNGDFMQKYTQILKKTRLFSGIAENEITPMLSCLDASVKHYKKGEYVFRHGQRIDRITVLISGDIHIQKDDYWGNRTIINRITPGEMFGEAYITPESGALINDVVANNDSTVMFFDVKKMLATCSSACRFHTMVIQNLFYAISDKNRKLVQKIGHISRRTTREKLISYLSEEAERNNSSEFEIPFNRQQLADYISVDRSAMSNELCKMRDEGLLEFDKNKFRLL